MASLSAIAALSDQKQKTEQYKSALQQTIANGSSAQCQQFADHILSDQVPLVVSRQLLTLFAQELSKLPADAHKEVAVYLLNRVQPSVVSYEEQVTAVREQLAGLLEKEEEWSKAAQTLAGIDLDSGMRVVDAEYKLQKNIKIAMLYLEDDDAVNAETFIKKAATLITGTKNVGLELQYKTCYARVLDSKRKFLQAATQYYELSQIENVQSGPDQVSEQELTLALEAAVTCCILAAAGPQRSRVLANLYKDERTRGLPVFFFLEKVYLERILRREEVEAFAQQLRPHQCAITTDGSTVLDRAVTEHNLAAASKLYNNIYFSELGQLLGCTPEKAESTASKMVMEDRLKANIDQVDGLISFTGSSEQLLQWDMQIQAICNQLNVMVDDLISKDIALQA